MRWGRGATGRAGRPRGGLALLAFALLLPALGAPAPRAAAAPAIAITASANFGGNVQTDAWAPITVRLANDGADLTGEVVARTNVAGPQGEARYVQRVELPARSRKALTLYVLIPNYPTAVQVSFSTGRETVEAAPVPLRPLKQGQRLIGAIGDDERASGAIAREILGAYGGTVEVIAVAPDELPDNSYGLGAFSALVLSDASTGRWSAEQRRALADWVARGGRLVVAGGPTWRKTAEGLGELPPVRFTDSRAAGGLGALVGEAGAASGPGGELVLAIGQPLAGAVTLVEQDGLPVVAGRDWGRGVVTALAFDPATASFLGWGGAAGFWKGLGLDAPLPSSLQEPFSMTGRGPYPGQSGYRVSNVLRDLPTLALPPVWVFGVVVLLFIVTIGPVNYLLLRRLDRRELAWVTIPALTLLFTAGIYGYGASTKGQATVVNTVSIVRIVPEARAAEVQSFYGVFTPSRGVRQLPVGHDALVTGFALGSRGPMGFGDSDLGDDLRFEQGQDAAARDASFAQWTLRAVAAQATLDPAPLMLRLELRREGGKVVGQITNETGRAIEDVTLLLDGAYHQVGNLAPGAGARVDWTPGGRYGATGPNYYGPGPPGLGAALYYAQPGARPGYYGPNRGPLGTAGRRAELLDALSGSVLPAGAQPPYPQRPPPPYGPPTPTPTPAAAGTAANPSGQTGSWPLQVLFWPAATPLELRIAGAEGDPTTLVIQEMFFGEGGAR